MPNTPDDLHICDVIQQQGIKTGAHALQECGMQPEFAAHLMLMANGTGSTIILRAGNPPNYDRPSTPKPGTIRSKSSRNQGPFNGYLSCEDKFTRIIVNPTDSAVRHAIGLHPDDKYRLLLPITDVKHLHAKQLRVNLHEIYFQLNTDSGDLKIKKYDPISGELTMQFREGKGSSNFHGVFIVKLHPEHAYDFKQIFSRPWNKPEQIIYHNLAETLQNFNKQSTAINLIPFEDKEFNLYYKDVDHPEALLKPAKILCKTPQNLEELITTLKKINHEMFSQVKDMASHEAALQKLGATELEKLYDQYGVIITCDWDGLVLSHPLNIDPKYLITYNTFIIGPLNKTNELIESTNNLFEDFKKRASLKSPSARTKFDDFILNLDFYNDIFNYYDVEHAGVLTPFELLYQQLSNYAYQQSCNRYFGEIALATGLYETINFIIQFLFNKESLWVKEHRCLNETEKITLLNLAKAKLSSIHDKSQIPSICKVKIEQHLVDLLTKHLTSPGFSSLKTRMSAPDFSVTSLVTHPDFDHNIDKLFQHGFDMRSPYGLETDGPWIMITADGLILKGNKQEQLIAVLLADDAEILRKSYFYINPQVNMSSSPTTILNWGEIIKKQIAMQHPVDTAAIMNLHNTRGLQAPQNMCLSLYHTTTSKPGSLIKSEIKSDRVRMPGIDISLL